MKEAKFYKPFIQELMKETPDQREWREEELREQRRRKDNWEDWSEEQSDLFVDMFGEGSSDGIKDFYKKTGEMFN